MKAPETVARYDMLPRGCAVVAGFSGGADSTALLHTLCALRGKLGLRVFAAHVNHGLRGAEAARDEAFVRARCKRWRVPLFVLHADVRAACAKTGESEETCGRRLRYAFFQQVAAPFGARIATAHTASDSAETFFLNLARGTGLAGLCGIPPVRGNIIRPLIETTREEVEAYCRAHDLSFVTDSTNASPRYLRNRVRGAVLPAFAAVSPAPTRMLGRTMRLLAQDEAALTALTRELLGRAATPCGWRADVLLDSTLCGRALCASARQATGHAPEDVHVRALRALLETGRGETALPDGWRARVEDGVLRFHRGGTPGETPPGVFLLAPGVYPFGPFTLQVELLERKKVKNLKIIGGGSFAGLLDCDKICGKAVLRAKCPGDAYHPAGRGVGKPLKKLFQERGISPALRPFIPLAADDCGVAWVWGFGPDTRCAPGADTVRAYLFSCSAGRKGVSFD